jgi:hypothetical protein
MDEPCNKTAIPDRHDAAHTETQRPHATPRPVAPRVGCLRLTRSTDRPPQRAATPAAASVSLRRTRHRRDELPLVRRRRRARVPRGLDTQRPGGDHVVTTSEQTTNATAIRPFTVDVPQPEIDALRARLAVTRWPDKETVDDRSQGVQLAKLRPLIEYHHSPLASSSSCACTTKPSNPSSVDAPLPSRSIRGLLSM